MLGEVSVYLVVYYVLYNEHDVGVGYGGLCSRAGQTAGLRKHRLVRELVTVTEIAPSDCWLSLMQWRQTVKNCPYVPMEDPTSTKYTVLLYIFTFKVCARCLIYQVKISTSCVQK